MDVPRYKIRFCERGGCRLAFGPPKPPMALGSGMIRGKRITDAWAEQKRVREIMVFLHSNGVGIWISLTFIRSGHLRPAPI